MGVARPPLRKKNMDLQHIIIWIKPVCVQCNAVKRRIAEALGAGENLSPTRINEFIAQDERVELRDLTAEENAKDLEHFKGLGYTSAPITEYGTLAIPGYDPDGLDRIIEKWNKHAAESNRG